MSNDLEELFRKSFEDFQESPQDQSWEKIKQHFHGSQKSVGDQSPDEDAFRQMISNLESEPSRSSWSNIKKYLFWKKFSPYIAGFSVLVLGALFIQHHVTQTEPIINKSVAQKPTDSNSDIQKSQEIKVDPLAESSSPLPPKFENETKKGSASLPVTQSEISHSISVDLKNINNSSFKIPLKGDHANRSTIQNEKADEPLVSHISNEKQVDSITITKIEKEEDKLNTDADTSAAIAEFVKPKEILTPADQHKKKKKFKYTAETNINNELAKVKYHLYGSQDFISQTIKGENVNPLYTDLRRSFETRDLSMSLGGGASYTFASGTSIYGGIQYQTTGFNTKYDFSQRIRIQYITASGQQIDSTLTTTIRFDGKYRLHFIEMPVMLRQSIGHGRLSYTVSLGVIPGIMAGRSGQMLVHDMITPSVGDVQKLPSTYFQNFQYAVTGGAGVAYQINHNYSFTVEPLYRISLSNIYTSSYPVRQTLQGLSVQLGMKYHLD